MTSESITRGMNKTTEEMVNETIQNAITIAIEMSIGSASDFG
jgi:GTP cyclohydrolase III